MNQLPFRINAARYEHFLQCIVPMLFIMHVSLYTWDYSVSELSLLLLPLFDLDEEYNLPTWFSCFLQLNNVFVLLVISQSETSAYKVH